MSSPIGEKIGKSIRRMEIIDNVMTVLFMIGMLCLAMFAGYQANDLHKETVAKQQVERQLDCKK